jgi:hypothetical protein
MRMLHIRPAGLALASVGIAVALAAAGCTPKQQDDVASLDKTPAAGAAKAEKSWAAYDAAIEQYVKCLHEKGIPGARYDGHKPKAQSDLDEISGIPVKNNTLPPAVAECSKVQHDKGIDLRALRPEPYNLDFTSPEDDEKFRQWLECLKDKGYIDLDAIQSRKAGDPVDPKQEADENACAKKAGLPENDGKNSDGSAG